MSLSANRETSGTARRSDGPQPGIARALRNSLTMAHRALLKVRHTPELWFDVTLQPILFTLMFAYIFGGAIAGDVKGYLPIIVPGILVQTVLTTSIVTGVQLREDMEKGVFDRFRSLPIARIAPLAGALMADAIRYAIASALTFAVGYLIGYRPAGGFGHVLAAMALAVVCAWSVSWIFAFFGVVARTAAGVQGASMLVLLPLTILSNAFVPVDTMPDWLQRFVNLNPVSHLVAAVRDLANAGTFSREIAVSLAGAAVITAVFAPLAVRVYMRRA